jgi:hypothetical protein
LSRSNDQTATAALFGSETITAQLREKLILDGKLVGMAFCPPLPKHDPRLVERTDEEIAALRMRTSEEAKSGRQVEPLAALDLILGSTACWRRYQGTWEVRDGQLFLNSIEGRFNLVGTEPLLADWFTGVLRVPRGEMLAYVHMGFGSVYAKELHIHVECGRVRGTRVYDNRGKEINTDRLGIDNLPGGENRFPGDRDFN